MLWNFLHECESSLFFFLLTNCFLIKQTFIDQSLFARDYAMGLLQMIDPSPTQREEDAELEALFTTLISLLPLCDPSLHSITTQ